jgi:large subunit ribosomal protein L33
VGKKKAGARGFISLECSKCGQRNYRTSKILKGQTKKLELKKYCKWDREHTLHKERKK